MNFKHLLTLVIVFCLGTFASAQKKSEITTAEQMVVYNKKNNKPQYDGLIVIYNYEIVNPNSLKSQDLIRLVETKFQKVLKAEVLKIGNKDILSITTEGKLANNDVYYEILNGAKQDLVQSTRELLLK